VAADDLLEDLPAHRSREEILAHPRFAEARNALIDAMLALYEHEPFLNRLLLEAGRNVVFTASCACMRATGTTTRILGRRCVCSSGSWQASALRAPRRIATSSRASWARITLRDQDRRAGKSSSARPEIFAET
jgi:hypothetical protein